MLPEIRFAARRLARSPAFLFTALLTLALCIGANLTIFGVVDSILIRSLPFPGADRLVTLYFTYPKLPNADSGASLTSYFERRGRIPALASLSAIQMATSVVGESGATSIENLGRVTPEFFDTLGVRPVMGRVFRDAEMTYQTDKVAMLSYECWVNRYSADPGILGKSIRMDGIERVIVGVLPPNFRFLSFHAPVYMPLSSEEGERNVGARHSLGTLQFARLAAGATLAQARAQIDADDAARAPEFPEAKLLDGTGFHTVVAPLQADYVASVRPALILMQSGALFLLLIGCVNLVNLLLIRASGRARELAVRQALGASQRHIVRDVMTETILLNLAGAMLGLLVGAAGIRLVGAMGADQLPLGSEIAFNARMAAAALLTALATGAAIGGPVAWFHLHGGLALALQSESRGSTPGRAMQRLRQGFIVAQVALAFILLAGAGLLALSLRRAMAVAPGFRADHVITGRFNLTWQAYHSLDTFHLFFDRLNDKAAALPGVSAFGAISHVPVVDSKDDDVVTVPGYVPAPGEIVALHDEFGIAGNYFEAMGIPLLEGRFLEGSDLGRGQMLCVVDESFARHYWPNGGAVGKQVYRGTHAAGDEGKPLTIVGVVGTVKQGGLTSPRERGAIYFSYDISYFRNYFLVARTGLAPEALATALVKTVREVDPDIPLTDLRSMEARISDSLATRRSPALMAAVFSASALLLATIGLYGVMAFMVAQRTREFGVRMALGAQASDVLRLVLGQGLVLTAAGLGIGLLGALMATRYMSSMLFGVQSSDPVAYAGVAAVFALVAGVACLLPARNATKVDPIVALRSD
ncbi:MAG TPA: ABC transporter permease [Opitutaceae bacterium]